MKRIFSKITDYAGSTAEDTDETRGHKRSHDEVVDEDKFGAEDDDVVKVAEEDEEPNSDPSTTELSVGKLQVNPDGSVLQEDKVKLWESGYRERYYRQKFGVEPTDEEFRKKWALLSLSLHCC